MRFIVTKKGKIWDSVLNKKPAFVKQTDGYLQIRFWEGIIRRGVLVHRLIAQKYIPNPFNFPQVNHKNGIKTDNRIENLEWVTNSQNQIHSHKVLGNMGVRGSKHPLSKLTENDVKKIRKNFVTRQITQKEMAKKFNISYTLLKNINARRVWKHI